LGGRDICKGEFNASLTFSSCSESVPTGGENISDRCVANTSALSLSDCVHFPSFLVSGKSVCLYFSNRFVTVQSDLSVFAKGN